MRVCIIGCGRIADVHAEEIRRIKSAEIVGVCDSEPLMADQLAERLGLEKSFTDPVRLLEVAKPDVAHITTPPRSHLSLATLCLDRGCHVLVEKPFTLNASQAESLIRLAKARALKLTVGHNAQFTKATIRMRQLVAEGYLGGKPVHLESLFCHDLANAKALLGDPSHWVRRLPGGLLHNVISHGISKIAEFMHGDSPLVIAHGFTSQALQALGETEILDEVRVIVRDDDGLTAYFTFSSQMRPALHQLRVYGPRNALVVDDDQNLLIRLPGKRLRSFLEPFVSPWGQARQYIAGSLRNIRDFLGARLHPHERTKVLFEAFYRSITDDGPVPIPYREILLTARIMDEVFAQLSAGDRRSTSQDAGSVDAPLAALKSDA